MTFIIIFIMRLTFFKYLLKFAYLSMYELLITFVASPTNKRLFYKPDFNWIKFNNLQYLCNWLREFILSRRKRRFCIFYNLASIQYTLMPMANIDFLVRWIFHQSYSIFVIDCSRASKSFNMYNWSNKFLFLWPLLWDYIAIPFHEHK